MDSYDLFKKLTFGTKLNVKQLNKNTEKSINEIFEAKLKSESHNSMNLTTKNEKKQKSDTLETNEEYDESFTIMTGINVTTSGEKRHKKHKKEFSEEKMRQLDKETINHFKNLHHISTTGKKVSDPVQNFEELFNEYNIASDLYENLKKCRYTTPTPIQMQAIPLLLKKRQLLACAPTGSGKTAAFLIPLIHHLKGPSKKGFRAVIISPTRELAKQTYRECLRLSEGRNFKVHIISKVKHALEKYGPKSSCKFDILITTPKRLQFLLTQDAQSISLNNVEWLIVDEADKLFEDSAKSFRSQLEEIMKNCTNPELKQAMFSATSTPTVTKWCRRNLKDLVTITIGHRNSAVDLVNQEILFVGDESGKLIAFRNIIHKGLTPPVLVFVQTKERAQALFKELIYDGIMVEAIHADRTQTQRDNIVKCFREGKIWVLICTDIMGRGIDFKGVNLVINYDFPSTAISYIHRIGRTGRAGRNGKAITFFTQKDTDNLRSIASVMRNSGCDIPDYMLTMKKPNKREKKMKIQENIKKSKLQKSISFLKNENAISKANWHSKPSLILQGTNNKNTQNKKQRRTTVSKTTKNRIRNINNVDI